MFAILMALAASSWNAGPDMRDTGFQMPSGGVGATACGPPPGTPILWVDGRDPLGGTIPADGATIGEAGVSAIVNKGSFGGTFSAAAGARPTYSSTCIGNPSNGCISFDGTNDAVSSSLAAASWVSLHSTDTSCLALFRQRTFSPETRQGIMGTAGSATTQRGLLMAFDDAASAENRMQIDMKNGGSVFSNRIILDNVYAAQLWNRAFYTFEAAAVTNAIKGYLGGVLVAQSGAQLAVPSVLASSNTLFLGNNATGNFLDGELAEVVCYSSVLTAPEQAALNTWADCIETDEPHGPMPLPTLAASTTICMPSEQPCRIGVMGDSITSTTSPLTWVNGFMRTAYPTSVAFKNVAVSSTTIEVAKTNQWQNNLRTSGIHSLFMLIGTNDIALVTSAADILADIDEVADAAIALNMKVVTVSILPRYTSYGAPAATRQIVQDDVNAGLASAADGFIRQHVDVYADMEDPVLTDDLLAAYDSGDHLHPNQTGQDALGAFIDSLLVVE